MTKPKLNQHEVYERQAIVVASLTRVEIADLLRALAAPSENALHQFGPGFMAQWQRFVGAVRKTWTADHVVELSVEAAEVGFAGALGELLFADLSALRVGASG